jgi:hypothetical protein
VVNRKVVDLTTLYNFHKGRMVFSQWILHKLLPNFECRYVLVDRRYCRLTTFSLISTQNLKCQSTEKLCPSTNWTTFILVDFEVFW